jgi:hypothetical protein
MNLSSHNGLGKQFSNHLTILADEVRKAHVAAEAAYRTSVEKAIEVGKLLLEAKAEVKHGEWLPWLATTGISARTAQRYMQLASLPAEKSDTVAHLGVKAALAEIARRPSVIDFLHELDEMIDELAALQPPADKNSIEYGVCLAKRLQLWGGDVLLYGEEGGRNRPGIIEALVAVRKAEIQQIGEWLGLDVPVYAKSIRERWARLSPEEKAELLDPHYDEITEIEALENAVSAKLDAVSRKSR